MSDKRFQKKLAKIEKKGERLKQESELRAKYEKYVAKKEKTKVSNIMLVVVIIAIVGYTAANFILQYYTSVEVSPTITTCWFSFFGAEVLALAGIRIAKTKNEGSDDQLVDWTSEPEDESGM